MSDRIRNRPSHSQQKSLLPGATGARATGSGFSPGPWQLRSTSPIL
jgi:hypothetical protein